MDEFRFVLRCFAFAGLLLVLTQIKTGDVTVEAYIQSSLVNSKVSSFVNKVADGGVKLLKDAGNYAKDTYLDWKKSEISDSTEIITSQISTAAKAQPSLQLETELIDEE